MREHGNISLQARKVLDSMRIRQQRTERSDIMGGAAVRGYDYNERVLEVGMQSECVVR